MRCELAFLVLAGVGLHASPARADRQTQCIADFEQAQHSRKQGKLLAARRQFQLCAEDSCPRLVRQDCSEALAQLATALPSIRVRLEDERGEEIEGYQLEIDGAGVNPGREPIELDPGEHDVVFRHRGRTARVRVLLRSGDIALPARGVLKAPSERRGATARPSAGPPVLAYILGGVAVTGLAGFVGFGLAGRSTESCKGSCSDEQIDTLHRQYLIADVSLLVGLLSGSFAGYLFLSERPAATAGRARPNAAAASLQFRARTAR
ncbi:MAG: hypothetical protein U0263_24420 [Polyangiaceae bacterium]